MKDIKFLLTAIDFLTLVALFTTLLISLFSMTNTFLDKNVLSEVLPMITAIFMLAVIKNIFIHKKGVSFGQTLLLALIFMFFRISIVLLAIHFDMDELSNATSTNSDMELIIVYLRYVNLISFIFPQILLILNVIMITYSGQYYLDQILERYK